MPKEEKKAFKRSRDKSKSSHTNLNDNLPSHKNNSQLAKDSTSSKDLPPIKKTKKDIHEIKDIDMKYVKNKTEAIKNLPKLNNTHNKTHIYSEKVGDH